MKITLKHQPSYALAIVELGSNEVVKVEPGAMVSMSAGIDIETKAEGGLFGGLKRMVAGESFFQNTFTAPSKGGEITLAPAIPGDMIPITLDGSQPFMLQSGAYIASEQNVVVNSKWGGAKGFFGSGSLVLLQCTGHGQMLAGCYGAVEERNLTQGEQYVVDTGHIIGFEGSIDFKVKKVGGWKSTLLSGEGLICELTGPGRVLMQTRSEQAFVSWLTPKMPKSTN
jgi:uncharacterized protein (TIGR00266 family)